MAQSAQPTAQTIVIFGASGDLTQRKLIPSLYHLFLKGRLDIDTNIIGMAIDPFTDETFRVHLKQGYEQLVGPLPEPYQWERFIAHVFYQTGNFSNTEDFSTLRDRLHHIEGSGAGRLYYLATSPTFYETIVAQLGTLDMEVEHYGWRRLVVEKPFGHDRASANALNKAIHAVFDETQIYRIDHYLGKETVQNILVFRFGNTIFEPVWNRNYIEEVQITVAESIGVGHRAGYYDHAGVLRDMFQNHLLQLLALVAMEPPASLDADAVRNEKSKVLYSVHPMTPDQVRTNTVRSQYTGYRTEDGVAADSQTATYAALRLDVDNWRWQGVPFYLRSGKQMTDKLTEIVVRFRNPPHAFFPPAQNASLTPNRLSLCVAPDEGIHLSFEAKVPDTLLDTESVDMEFHYQKGSTPEAYERLLLDALHGEASLFARADGIDLAWGIIDPILNGWALPDAEPLTFYAPGSWGPAEADRLLAHDKNSWLYQCGQTSNMMVSADVAAPPTTPGAAQ